MWEEEKVSKKLEDKEWLEEVKEVLLKEDFEFTPFQDIKPGQTFGLVKDLNEKEQMHVRGFKDGHLESEIEISRYFLEHSHTSRPAGEELSEILDKHGIDYEEEKKLKNPGETGRELPTTLTDWRSEIHPKRYKIIGGISVITGMISLVFSAYFLGVLFEGMKLPEGSITIFQVMVGILLIFIGGGIIHYSNIIDKALEGKLEPPKPEEN